MSENFPVDDAYERRKARELARQAQQAAAGQEIGPLPGVVDPERRAAGLASFRVFCETYLAAAFPLPWSADHLKVIAKIEQAVDGGNLFAVASPRGDGKTTRAIAACLWAIVKGRARFVLLVAASALRAKKLLKQIKTWCETNDLLLEDFPEVFYPIRRLDRIVNRQSGQKYMGQPTRISWLAEQIVFPTIAGSAVSGSSIAASGLEGSDIRGQLHVLENGESIRPDLVIIDDPQTRKSASSELQTQTREECIAGDILGMAGPGKKIAGILCCTVIRPDDLSARMLDREKHPEWQSEITKLVYEFPSNEALWDQYWDIRRDLIKNELDPAPATEFYRNNQAAMDAGFVGSWSPRFKPDEISHCQSCMNLLYTNRQVFFAEYQNDPIPQDDGEKQLTAEQIAAKINGHDRGVIPREATHLTAMIDVMQDALFYAVTAWGDDFTGNVVDYGTWPDQQRPYFALHEVRKTLAVVTKEDRLEGSLYAGLEALCKMILGREWQRADGATMRVERCLIDAQWGNSTDVVYKFCRQSQFSGVVMPSHGHGVKASERALNDGYKKKPGERVGLNWRVTIGDRRMQKCLFDSNYWKSFVHRGFGVAMGNSGCLSLFGEEKTAQQRHRMIADHVTAEFCVRTMRVNDPNGREVDEWKLRVGRPDNHWLDCLVGCAVAASMQGCDTINPGRAAGMRTAQGPRPTARALAERGRR